MPRPRRRGLADAMVKPTSRRTMPAALSLLLVVVVVLLLVAGPSTTSAAASSTASTAIPAHSSSGSSKITPTTTTTTKTLHGSVCTKADRACTACVKSTSSSKNKKSPHALICTSCTKGSVLIDGRCYCPAGSALAGSKLTTNSNNAAGPKSSSATPAHSSKSKGKSGPPSCALCGVNAYSTTANLVSSSRCSECPDGSTTRGATGSTTCYVEAGFYFNPLAQEVKPCPDGYSCAGGDILAEGQVFVDIDECAAPESPCLNKGVCSNLPGTFSCDCSGTGYQGSVCETDIDECSAPVSPCLNNSVCSNLPGSFSCDCDKTGYQGSICETDIDECALSTPQFPACRNNGVCSNLPGSFSCDCTGTGFTDSICQTDVDECALLDTPEAPLCLNNGLCKNTVGSFECLCDGTGYEGATCQNDIDECSAPVSPCTGADEICVNTPPGSYTCAVITPGGLNVGYYKIEPGIENLPDFATMTPYLTTSVADINFALSMSEFANSGLSDNVGARFSGYVDVPSEGLWTFYLSSDDGSKLWIDGNVVVDHDGLHGTTEKSGQVELTKGRHALQIDYMEGEEASSLKLSWSGPGTSKEVIPSSSLLRLA